MLSIILLFYLSVINQILNNNELSLQKKHRNMHHIMVNQYESLLIIIIGISFIETSALDSTNVDKAFMKVINDIYHQTMKENYE
jgi:GTPase SAR1 family protein